MGNYDSVAQVQDATYGLMSTIDDQDKFIVDITMFLQIINVSKPFDDIAAGTATLDFPVYNTGNAVKLIAIGYNSRLSIPVNGTDYVTFSAKRYVNGALAQVIAEYKTSTDPVTAFVPAFMNPLPNTPFVLQPNDVLVLSIAKTGAGQIVGAGNWQIVAQAI